MNPFTSKQATVDQGRHLCHLTFRKVQVVIIRNELAGPSSNHDMISLFEQRLDIVHDEHDHFFIELISQVLQLPSYLSKQVKRQLFLLIISLLEVL